MKSTFWNTTKVMNEVRIENALLRKKIIRTLYFIAAIWICCSRLFI